MTLKKVNISSLVYMYVTAFNYNEYGLVDWNKKSIRLFFYVKEEQKENKRYDSAYPMSRLKDYFQYEYNKAMAFAIFQSAKGVNSVTGEYEELPEQSQSRTHECIENFIDMISPRITFCIPHTNKNLDGFIIVKNAKLSLNHNPYHSNSFFCQSDYRQLFNSTRFGILIKMYTLLDRHLAYIRAHYHQMYFYTFLLQEKQIKTIRVYGSSKSIVDIKKFLLSEGGKVFNKYITEITFLVQTKQSIYVCNMKDVMLHSMHEEGFGVMKMGEVGDTSSNFTYTKIASTLLEKKRKRLLTDENDSRNRVKVH